MPVEGRTGDVDDHYLLVDRRKVPRPASEDELVETKPPERVILDNMQEVVGRKGKTGASSCPTTTATTGFRTQPSMAFVVPESAPALASSGGLSGSES